MCAFVCVLSAFDHTMQNVPVPVHLQKSSCIGPVVVVRWGTTGEHPVLNATQSFCCFFFAFLWTFVSCFSLFVVFFVVECMRRFFLFVLVFSEHSPHSSLRLSRLFSFFISDTLLPSVFFVLPSTFYVLPRRSCFCRLSSAFSLLRSPFSVLSHVVCRLCVNGQSSTIDDEQRRAQVAGTVDLLRGY